MESKWLLSPDRQLTDEEKKLIWKKPTTHKISEEEIRISNEVRSNWNNPEMKINNILLEGDAGTGKTELAKALSSNFGLPYTKITCFADMDKSDVLGAILPILSEDQQSELDEPTHNYLKTLYQYETMKEATEAIASDKNISYDEAQHILKEVILKLESYKKESGVQYRFYPSEIVRAFQRGYVLEIQEPTVIRDAAVLMALNSALEAEGSINLPTGIIKRHPDFIVVITTNRGYSGCRVLNEALRDRIHHAEKMNLPSIETMVERAMAKTGCKDEALLQLLARTIRALDEISKANAIKGVAGMRSYFYWVDAVVRNIPIKEALYYKVIYKMTTDESEINILEQGLMQRDLLVQLEEIQLRDKKKLELMEIETNEDGIFHVSDQDLEDETAIGLRKASSSKGHSDKVLDTQESRQSEDDGTSNQAFYHELKKDIEKKRLEEQKYRRALNEEARKVVSHTMHKDIKMIVHRPEVTEEGKNEYKKFVEELSPVIEEMTRRAKAILEHENSESVSKNKMYGTKFCIENVVKQDFRYFARKNPPEDSPSLVVALRIDESASMSAFGRIEAAKRAAVAVYEFCRRCNIPVLIYGDTADRSKLEQMSLFAYCDVGKVDEEDRFRLMQIQARSNNRDGMVMSILAEKLLKAKEETKLMICISDGQPKAMPDYSGAKAKEDMQHILSEYRRKGINFLAAAIGQDKEMISELYGKDSFLDISDLTQLPRRLIEIITRYL